MNKLALYFRLIRLDKPIGTVLLLWPTLCALWLAQQGVPDWRLLLIFVLGTFLMRSAGCAINDYADQDIDKFVKRTAERPITSGRISGKEALIMGMAQRGMNTPIPGQAPGPNVPITPGAPALAPPAPADLPPAPIGPPPAPMGPPPATP